MKNCIIHQIRNCNKRKAQVKKIIINKLKTFTLRWEEKNNTEKTANFFLAKKLLPSLNHSFPQANAPYLDHTKWRRELPLHFHLVKQ